MTSAGGFIDLGNQQLLVLDTTGMPYAIMNKQGATLLGGNSGPAAPTFKFSVGGVTLVAGDQLVGGASTTGTPGSGSFVGGFAVLDANGNLVGNWIPRTGTLASLNALALYAGEVASATDIPALVQGTGTAGVNFEFFPFSSVLSGSLAGTGAVSATLPCTASSTRLTVGAGITSVIATLQNGYIDGQELTVELISSPSTLTSYTVNGSLIAGNTGVLLSASITPANAILCKFRWNSASSSWYLAEPGVWTQNNPTGTAGAYSAGGNNTLGGLGAVCIGYANAAYYNAVAIGGSNSGGGGGGRATGDFSTSIGGGSVASGSQSAAVGYIAVAYADQAFALGPTSAAYGPNTTAIGTGAFAYGQYSACLGTAGSGGSAFGFASATLNGGYTGNNLSNYAYTSVNNASFPNVVFTGTSGWTGTGTTALEVGKYVIVPLALYNVTTLYAAAQITAVTATTLSVTVTNSSNNNPVPTACAANGIIYDQNDGQNGLALNYGSAARNQCAIAKANGWVNSVAGDNQAEEFRLGATTSSTSQITLGLAGVAVSDTYKTFGNSFRVILETNKMYAVRMKLLAKQNGTANCVVCERNFVMVNNGGTVSIPQTPVTIGTDLVPTGAPWTTWSFASNVSVAANATYGSVDVKVTPPGAQTISWKCLLECEEILQ